MAHAIDLSNGKENFVSYKQKPWHGLGTILETEMSVQDALNYGGLDFGVHKLPNIHQIPFEVNGIKGKENVKSTNSFFTYRDDTRAVLGDKLGKDYTVLQNLEALGVLDLILANNSGIILETAGSIKGGSTVFVTAKMPNPIVVGKSDEVEQYLVASNSHDGSSAVRVMFTPIRVVCQNTLTMAIANAKKSHSIRHTTNVKENFQQSLKLMGLALNNEAVATESFNQLAKTQLRKYEFWNYVGNVFLSEKEISDIKSGMPKDEAFSTQKIKLIDNVMEYAHTGAGQAEAGEMTAWWAYNAVTGYLSNTKQYKDAEKRFEGLVANTGIIEKAYDLASTTSRIISLSSNSELASNLNYN